MKYIFYALLIICAISLVATIVSVIIAMRKKDSEEEERVFKIAKKLFDVFYTTGGMIAVMVILTLIIALFIK